MTTGWSPAGAVPLNDISPIDAGEGMSMDSTDAVVPAQQAMGPPAPTHAPACAVVVNRAGGNPTPSQAPGYSTPRRGATPAADGNQVPLVGPDDSISQASVGSARRQEQQRLAIMAAAYQTQVATTRRRNSKR